MVTKAYELLSDPAKFCVGSYALDAEWNNVEPTDPSAVCFCAVGAVAHVYGEVTFYEPKVQKLRSVFNTPQVGKDGITYFSPEGLNNSPNGREAVVELLKELDL